MAFPTLSVFFFLVHLSLLTLCDSHCPESFPCKNLDPLKYPLTMYGHPYCGLLEIDCDSSSTPKLINLGDEWTRYDVMNISYSSNELTVRDTALEKQLNRRECSSLTSIRLQSYNNISFTISPNLTLFKCGLDLSDTQSVDNYFKGFENKTCEGFRVYYRSPWGGNLPGEVGLPPLGCHRVHLPMHATVNWSQDLFQLLTYEYTIEWHFEPTKDHFENYENYSDCTGFTVYYGNQAGGVLNDSLPSGCSPIHLPLNTSGDWSGSLFKLIAYEYTIEWHIEPTKGSRKKIKVALAAAIPGAAFLLVCLLSGFLICRNKKRDKNAYYLSRNLSSDPSSKSDIEGGILYFGIPVISYTDLVEATNNFDSSRELGDGGFGTVYYGKLRDGREVAIKRLYEHNYRRVEQFMNEIKILTSMKHPNLVTLYGCTSRRSRELLLVYEYVENGTVADHLHGEKASNSPLTWSIRLNIAMETANALTFLHKSGIVHRDVKTNNILLTGNFCVKVADFGLSRLFPTDVTHISTAPQGTPGYVDPEYHQCYQLTDKSDVYSFGVVLVELVSSLPAVDVNRHRHEINLANFALSKIQKCCFDELIDSSLGYGTDAEVTRMTTSVAELAFRCLQPEKEMRPSMDEVLDYLKDIQSGHELMFEKVKEEGNGNAKMFHSPETDDAVLLKNKNLRSPVAVTDKWISSSSTTESTTE
ncbi:putative serine/threonine-protein kinase-like [Dorcoceras hygrometricum]|uniref:Putative serine/threonine-protein kinase-like n=1 Tax=Dorcoceras hygrometricum TaxID=472368 RepID=A0A2Z7BKI3_9LAMI|nr:putative serine/threonine-protein kinase-like [Dorcoceras hygrometricum]